MKKDTHKTTHSNLDINMLRRIKIGDYAED